ncbi:uncharacterized protein LOC134237041 [Saccostrea cucullata]|uniref:uncharacterized protein LOC134237041 n=1 Tax=Saccostrea cuccullata TaxID=36930 RepID=UPI002ED2498B
MEDWVTTFFIILIVFIIVVHGILLIIIRVCCKKNCCDRGLQTRSYRSNSTLSGYHASRHRGIHFTTQTSLDTAMHRSSSTENFDLNSFREEPRNAPISTPHSENTDQGECHIVTADLTESSNFLVDGFKFEDCPNVPPPSYSSLFE